MSSHRNNKNYQKYFTPRLFLYSGLFSMLGALEISIPLIQADTTITQTTNQTTSVDTSKLVLGTESAFESTDKTLVALNGNDLTETFATNVINLGQNHLVYQDNSQIIELYKTDEDLSQATVSVYDVRHPDQVYYTTKFTTFTVQGKQYFGFTLPSSVIKTAFEHGISNGATGFLSIQNGSKQTSSFNGLQVLRMAAGATLSLPDVNQTATGSKASTFIEGQTAKIMDANGTVITSVTLTADDVTVTDDNDTANTYQYQLSKTGQARIQQILTQLNNADPETAKLYYQLDNTDVSGKITLTAADVPDTTPATTVNTTTDNETGIATVHYIDQRTNRTLSYEVLAGSLGEPILFDTYQQISPFQAQGYHLVENGTTSYSPSRYQLGNQNFKVYLKKNTNHRRDSNTNSSPITSNQNTVVMNSTNDDDGGGGAAGGSNQAADELAAYFLSLSGKINFGKIADN